MTYTNSDKAGIKAGPAMMSAGSLSGDDVYNHKGEDLGEIKEIMLDMRSGRVAYAVLSYGGFLGMGEKLFAVPWNALTLDPENKRFVLYVEKDRLKDAPGFDKDHWPDMGDPSWSKGIHSYYGTTQHLDDTRL
ncbi:PRC-barrel domain-containing protein [Rhodocyclaceae bacterium SMB388]